MKTNIELNQLKEYLIFNNIKEKDITLFLEKISLHSYQKNDIIIKEYKDELDFTSFEKSDIFIIDMRTD